MVGIYIIEAADHATAQAAARECPIVHVGGAVEIRETDFFPGSISLDVGSGTHTQSF